MFKFIEKTTKFIKLKNVNQFSRNTCYFANRNNNLINRNCACTPRVQYTPLQVRSCSSQNADTSSVGIVNFEAIANGDEEVLHKLKVLQLEMEVMRQEGRCVPPDEHMKEAHWKELLNLKTISSRRKYLEYLFKLSKKKENAKIKKEEQRKIREERLKERPEVKSFEEFVKTYDLQHNNIFLRFYDTTINQLYNNQLIKAMMFGQKLVVDCGYDDKMTPRENKNTAKQLMLLFADNRMHEDPYDVHFCNANPESILIKGLHKFIPTMYEPWFPMNVHQKSYLDLFPKDQLVYLTPHCREEMTEYDHDAIYIIGAIVDKVNNEPLSLAKAKKEKLRMVKFPLDRYLQWGGGSGKSLTLNQVISILLDLKRTGDWEYALRHVPRRKIVDYSIGKHIEQHTNTLRTDKYTRTGSWSPAYNERLDAASYNTSNSFNQQNKKAYIKANERKKRLVNTRSIMYDDD